LSPGIEVTDGKYYIASDLKNTKSEQDNLLPPSYLWLNLISSQISGTIYYRRWGYNLEDFVIHPNSNTIFALSSNKVSHAQQNVNKQDAGRPHLLDISTSGAISEVASSIKGKYPSGIVIDSD
jgi:hypothetical protein